MFYLLSAIVFWFLLYFGSKAYFNMDKRYFNEDSSGSDILKGLGCFMIWSLMVISVSVLHFVVPAKDEAKAEFIGTPIVNEVQSLEGKVFTPQAFVVTEKRILVYDKDGKVYALDGIRLDDGLKPEQLAVASNITYTVYQKGGQLLFGKL